ncbi:pyridoxamine 5'-phosphate oxidase family protein [Muricauda sp. JGD-17]|uniref:Pyridoxamine 5'-phosphate oxidase family protein n=1 Tax=Flagellimonas ochracea TaxID=2696472 RepID=A0A964WYQ9_9FLAO|nr:pyridoxamine 5'-phosphate oxidase family protein [Allomuricauda ochracea]NAY93157.1 pyridoxamine 5'-phosphate oxidase family protein [Allomuricauda ochracea]
MIQDLFKELTAELRLGASKKGHPFRYFALATQGLQNDIGLRTVVLRRVSPEFHLTFYTDSRSSKIKELNKNQHISALFYHPKKLFQLKVEGKGQLVTDRQLIENHWKNVPTKARRDYTVFIPPGSTIKSPEAIDYLQDKNHFAIVNLIPQKFEYLKLGRPNHTRVQFLPHGNIWKGTYLIP